MPRSAKLQRRRLRGVTLIEVLIVVAILSLLSAGIGAAVLHVWIEQRIKLTTNAAVALREAAQRWRAFGSSDCPTAARLKQDKLIDKASRLDDAWGTPFVIACEDEDFTVVSWGPDKRPDTSDDIRVPPP